MGLNVRKRNVTASLTGFNCVYNFVSSLQKE